MAGELASLLKTMMSNYEKMDFEALMRDAAHDVQAVDEISKSWLRTRQDMSSYFEKVGPAISSIKTELTDIHETIVGDMGFVTAWLEQTYTFDGEKQHLSAPTTVVFRREEGTWKFTLFHSIPLPDEG
jgi:ketosteroid isomerase-like protein